MQWRVRLPELHRLIELERRLDGALTERGIDAEVDGHDLGRGECNLFLITTAPAVAFRVAHALVVAAHEAEGFGAGFRPVGSEDSQRLFPPGDDSPFTVT